MQLATDLAMATAQIGSLQLEIAAVRKKEAELRTQLESTLTSDDRKETEFSTLKVQFAGKGVCCFIWYCFMHNS